MSLLHYQETGPKSGPAVVLIHSLATSSEVWAHQVPVWSMNFRVVCVDLPGHGRSAVSEDAVTLANMAEQVVAVLDHLQIASAAFVGISLGGMVTQAAALNHPHRVSAMVIAHAGARTDAAVSEIWNQRIQQFEVGGIENLAHPTLERWFPRAFSESSPMTMEWMASLIEATDPRGYVMAIRAIQQLDHLDRLPQAKMPTLVVAGQADAAIPEPVASMVANRIPNAQLRLLEDTGHIGCVQKPVEFTETVGQFLLSALKTESTQSQKGMETLK
jgi:3-oxoadipate enol-lactonase